MHDIHMFDREGPFNPDDFKGSGADWLKRYKPHIDDGETVASPEKVYINIRRTHHDFRTIF